MSDTTATSNASSSAALPSVSEWCSTYRESLPALSAPNPDGRELEFLDLYVARYQLLGFGAPGLPPEVAASANRLADAYLDIRQRVAEGEVLADILRDVFADEQSDLIAAGSAFDEEATKACQ